jgi:hypothetical protein
MTKINGLNGTTEATPFKLVPPLKGLSFKITAYPALKRWAIFFRPATRDWLLADAVRGARSDQHD